MKEDKFVIILEKYQSQIMRTCKGYAEKDDAKDLFQEVCINLWRNIDSFRNESQLYTWIYRITVNTCLLYIKRERRNIVKTMNEIPDIPIDDFFSDVDERITSLQKAISNLPDKDRLIILMYLEEISHFKIGEIMGMSANYVGVKINRIKQKILKSFTYHE